MLCHLDGCPEYLLNISEYLTEYLRVQNRWSGGYTMKAIAYEFGVHYATVSRAVKNYENSQNED